MIAPESIDLTALPSVALCDRATLPSVPAVYFCLSESREVLYVGITVNLARRWKQHHIFAQIEGVGEVQVAWLECSDPHLLPGIEAALIDYFNPVLNCLNVGFGRQASAFSVYVSKVAHLRGKAGLTQRQLADAVGVTESTIRNLEKSRNGIEQIERIVKLCRALGCNAEDLIEYKSVEEGEINA